MRSGQNVQGLTTAATIWLSAAIGVAAGLGNYQLAGCCVALALLTLLAFEFLENRLFPDSNDSSARSATAKTDESPRRDELSQPPDAS
jgi:putative Mg2+ transporter-C (MgtC) family protein